ncbi:MAG: DUF192 domain-containing protein [Planctomycetes bacterium]|nr:DUF192 domain-containing protein [Planctomycetota bacterium]
MKNSKLQNTLVPTAAAILLLGVLTLTGCSRREPHAPARVRIGESEWRVELAITASERYRGLSGREAPKEGAGMLFMFPKARPLEFCMRGCDYPLDIAFIGPDMRVVQTYTMAVEPDRAGRRLYRSRQPAQFALEVRGGELAEVRIGQKVRFLGNVPGPAKADPFPRR